VAFEGWATRGRSDIWAVIVEVSAWPNLSHPPLRGQSCAFLIFAGISFGNARNS